MIVIVYKLFLNDNDLLGSFSLCYELVTKKKIMLGIGSHYVRFLNTVCHSSSSALIVQLSSLSLMNHLYNTERERE